MHACMHTYIHLNLSPSEREFCGIKYTVPDRSRTTRDPLVFTI